MANIQSFPVINSDDGILFTQDENKNIAISVDETVTTEGNVFNGASQLVKLDENGALPAVDGSNLTGLATSQIPALQEELATKLDVSDITVTKQGNIFNGANQLVQLNSSGQLPALDGSLLTNLQANTIVLSDSSSSTVTLMQDRIHTLTPTKSDTLVLPSSINVNCAECMIKIINGTTAYTITLPTGVKWKGDSIPDLTIASSSYYLIFWTINSGTLWEGAWFKGGS